MPTPLGHSLAGLAIWVVSIDKLEAANHPVKFNFTTLPISSKSLMWALFCVFAANVPDLDFIHLSPTGSIAVSGIYHHGITHSIGFAFVLASLVALWTAFRKRELVKPAFFITFTCSSSHLILDTLSIDSYEVNGIGLPMLWPFTDYFFHYPMITPFDRANILNPSNITALVIEITITGGLVVAAFLYRRRQLASLKL